MPKYASSMVFPASSPPLANAVVATGNDGTIISISSSRASFREMAGVEFYSGILVPGLVDVLADDDKGDHLLMAAGIRAAGRQGSNGIIDRNAVAIDGGLEWTNRYGRQLAWRLYDGTEGFRNIFSESDVDGVYRCDRPGGSIRVLSGRGKPGLLELMYELQEGPDRFALDELLGMATLNGAIATGFDGFCGSIAPGMRPGLCIIEGVDLINGRLLPVSRIRRLI